jgi:chitinase
MRPRSACLAVLTLAAASTAFSITFSSPALAALSTNWYGAAPYVMPLDNNPPDLGQVMAATGQKAFELAFVLAPNGGGCSPTWDGTTPLASDGAVASMVNTVRGAGGDVSVSAGGYGGTKLGQTCGDPQSTANAYQQVISRYGLHAIDFDLEEPEYENSTAIANEVGAAQILQRNNPGLYVSVTTAGTAAGTGYFGQQLLNTAKSIGFTPDNYSIMPFDGGFNGSASQISALEAFHSILMNTFGWDSGKAYAHEGVSGMNGRTDIGEYFYQSDFQNVLSYATGHGLSRYTFWSVNRDRQCNPPDNNGVTSGVCSSVAQASWDFTKYTAQFAGAAPGPGPGPGPGSGATGPITGVGGKCVDVRAASTANGTAVQLYDCNGTNAQQWTVAGDGSIHALGKCLDVTYSGTANGTLVQLWDCNGTGAQRWRLQANGSLVNPNSSRCLDDPYGNTTNGTQLQIWDCNGGANQQWHPPAGPITGVGGKCVDVRAASTANGTAVQLYDCNGTNAQQWTVAGDGSLHALGKCLDVTYAGTANGTLIQLWDCNGTGAQQWRSQSDGTLVNTNSGRCLDDPYGNTTNATQLQIWDCNGGTNQQWSLS